MSLKASIAILVILVSACGKTEADTKSGTGAGPRTRPPAPRAPSAKDASAKWRIEMKNGVISDIAIAHDGDIVAGGPIKGKSEIAGQTIESKYDGVWIARLASNGALKWVKLIDPPKTRYTTQYLDSLSIAPDGGIRVAVKQYDEPPYLRRVSITADGATQAVDVFTPGTKTRDSSLFVNGDALVSVRPGKNDKCKGVLLQRARPGSKQVWSVCNGDVDDDSALNRTAILPDDRSAICAGEWVAAFSSSGKRTWEVKHPEKLSCESIAIFGSGDVIVIFDGQPTMSATMWKANGKAAWIKKCTDLLQGSGNCLLEAVTVQGDDAILAVRNNDASIIAVLDRESGAMKKSYSIRSDASIKPVTASDSTIVYGTTSPSAMTIEGIHR